MCRCVRFPATDLALAALTRGEADVNRLLDRLENRLGVEVEHRPDPRGDTRAEVRDVIDLVLVQADAFHQIDLNLVRGYDPAKQILAVARALLRDREQRRDIV